MSYRSEITCVSDLRTGTVSEMTWLYLDHYDGSSAALFHSDLREKDEVILIYHTDKLVGFTALKIYRTEWNGKPIRVVYSGDTIVSPKHWGQQTLAFAWLAHSGEIKRQHPTLPLYWFLLVKGHRTYRYLPAFAKTFFPHWETPRADLKPLADQLASARFGDDYDFVSGVVRFARSHGHLKAAIAEPCGREASKPAIRFFREQNPGYRQGHELVCICELEMENMKPLAARLFEPAGKRT